MSDFILFIFAFTIFLLLTIANIKLLYRRYLKSYRLEIDAFLKDHGQKFETIFTPNNQEWNNSPFKKPPLFRIGVYRIGSLIWNDQKYRIIQTDKGKIIWLEIDTTYLRKPILTFRFGKTEKSKNLQNQNISLVKDCCPACGFHLNENDYECPDCGLNFR